MVIVARGVLLRTKPSYAAAGVQSWPGCCCWRSKPRRLDYDQCAVVIHGADMIVRWRLPDPASHPSMRSLRWLTVVVPKQLEVVMAVMVEVEVEV